MTGLPEGPWQVVVPFRQGEAGKSRLAPLLSASERAEIALRMARHVMSELSAVPNIASLAVLAPHRPDWWDGYWVRDTGLGLNPELGAWRAGIGQQLMLVIHADLPLLQASEVSDLLSVAALTGAALAPDRAGSGTNALAIADGRPMTFRFGPDSRAAHSTQHPEIGIVRHPGLMIDIDTPADVAEFSAVLGLRERQAAGS